MRIIDVKNTDSILESLRTRPNDKLRKKVASVISDVQKRKDKALREYEQKFSKTNNSKSFKVTQDEIKNSYTLVSTDQIEAIKIAKRRLERSEGLIKKQLKNVLLKTDGTRIEKTFLPLDSVGCYIPGGKARYPSTVVMSVVPAKVAGVKRIIAVSPADKGVVDPLTLVAADICGVDEFYKIGGAQAIAALAYGTQSIPKVDKIVGPGGIFVTLAKSILSNVVSIDMVAGPTELAIVADSSADPTLVVVDLISQAEHSQDTTCCLITNSKPLKDQVIKSLKERINLISRSDIVKASFKNNGFIAMCKTESQMIDLANKLAPEHLEVMTRSPQKVARKIKSAGLVLVGQDTPSSASDYLLGSNHILPTGGFGKTRGSLGVLDYIKLQTRVESSKASLEKISKYMKAFTDAEGLPNHYEAVWSRT